MANQQNQPTNQPAQSSSKTKPPSILLPITPDREKMSRALGAAFLQHKVQQLERNLDDLSFKRDLHQPCPRPHHNYQNKPNRSNKNQSKKKSLLQPDSKTDPPSSSSDSCTPAPIKLIDTSMLIHALPILKKWVREEKFKIVIPLDVVSELDFLKNSPPPIHGLVREATCWLDKQFQNSSKQSSTDSSHKACFIPQRTGHESAWEQLSQRFIAPPLEVASIPFIKEFSEDEEGGRPREEGQDQDPQIDYRPLISTDLPHEYRSLLQCALYYQLHAQSQQESELVIFFSDKQPSSTPVSRGNVHQNHQPTQHHQEEEPIDKSLDLSNWAERFEIKIRKLHLSDLAHAKQWIRSYNDQLKQQQQLQQKPYHHSQWPGPSASASSIPSHTTTATNASDQGIHSNNNRSRNSRQKPSPDSKPSAPSSTAVDKRLFVW